jgi:hypothetical protein
VKSAWAARATAAVQTVIRLSSSSFRAVHFLKSAIRFGERMGWPQQPAQQELRKMAASMQSNGPI